MKKKILVLAMTAMMGATVLTGCGEKEKDNNKSETSTDSTKEDDKASDDLKNELIEKENLKTDKENEEYLSGCMRAALNNDDVYYKFLDSSLRELVFTDADSAMTEFKKIGDSLVEEVKGSISDLEKPKSEGAKEYVVTWDVAEEDGEKFIDNMECRIRLDDGTYLKDIEETVDVNAEGLSEVALEQKKEYAGKKQDHLEYVNESKRSVDFANAEYIKLCINAAFNDKECKQELMNSQVRELVFTDATSIKAACEGVGENLVSELSNTLAGLQAPISDDAKEYVVKWEIDGNGIVNLLKSQIRLNDGTLIVDEEAAIDDYYEEEDESIVKEGKLVVGDLTKDIEEAKESIDSCNYTLAIDALNAVIWEDPNYDEFFNTSAEELTITDGTSVETACGEIGENIAKDLSELLKGLSAPISKDAKEYVITWDIGDDGELWGLEGKLRLNDGSIALNEDGNESFSYYSYDNWDDEDWGDDIPETPETLDEIIEADMQADRDKEEFIANCFTAATNKDDVYKEFIDSPIREMVFTDAASVVKECKKIGTNLAKAVEWDLFELYLPRTKGAKEYVVTWDIAEENGEKKIQNFVCNVRFEDGTFLEDKDVESIKNEI